MQQAMMDGVSASAAGLAQGASSATRTHGAEHTPDFAAILSAQKRETIASEQNAARQAQGDRQNANQNVKSKTAEQEPNTDVSGALVHQAPTSAPTSWRIQGSGDIGGVLAQTDVALKATPETLGQALPSATSPASLSTSDYAAASSGPKADFVTLGDLGRRLVRTPTTRGSTIDAAQQPQTQASPVATAATAVPKATPASALQTATETTASATAQIEKVYTAILSDGATSPVAKQSAQAQLQQTTSQAGATAIAANETTASSEVPISQALAALNKTARRAPNTSNTATAANAAAVQTETMVAKASVGALLQSRTPSTATPSRQSPDTAQLFDAASGASTGATSAASTTSGNGQTKLAAAQSAATSGNAASTKPLPAQPVVTAQAPTPAPLELSIEPDIATDGAFETPSEMATTSANTAQPHAIRSAQPAVMQAWSALVQKMDGGAQKFEIRLDPAELGEIDVTIELSKDNKARIVMAVSTSEAMTELTRGAKALEQALAESGVDLSEDGISFEMSSDDRSSFTFEGDADDKADGDRSTSATDADADGDNPPDVRHVGPQMTILNRLRVNVRA